MRSLYTWIALSLTAPAFAQDRDRDREANTDGFYVGAGLGDFSTGVEDLDELDDVDADDLDFDPDNSARKLFAGWRFNRFFGVQVDWIDFDRSVAALNQLNFSTESEGFAPSIVGTLPLGPVELFARAGILWYDLQIERGDTPIIDDSDRDPIYGAGIGVTVARRLNLRAEYEVVDIDQLDDSDAIWLTAAWRF